MKLGMNVCLWVRIPHLLAAWSITGLSSMRGIKWSLVM